tara:strand:- start:1515 stop:1688 length:174 start_codon:yes stop_codon:yes gene_type:complete
MDWLHFHNIPYTEKNVSQKGVVNELTALGYQATPVVIIEGKQAIVGYNTKKLAEALL